MNVQSNHRRDVVISIVCAILLVALGVVYAAVRLQLATPAVRGIRGTVIAVTGNTITVRDVGKDGVISDDDMPTTVIITPVSVINVPQSDGSYAPDSTFHFIIGDLVTIPEDTTDAQ